MIYDESGIGQKKLVKYGRFVHKKQIWSNLDVMLFHKKKLLSLKAYY